MRLSPQMMRRKLFASTFLLPGFSALLSPATATEARQQRLVCPFAPGGIADRLCRTIAAAAQSLTNQTWVVENVVGGGGLIGTARVARSAPDRHSIVMAATGLIRTLGGRGNPAIDFDPLRALRAVSVIGSMPILCVVPSGVPAINLRNYIDYLRSNSLPFTFASSGHASTAHIIGALIARQAGVDFVHVPFTGAAPALSALAGDHIPCALLDPMPVVPMLASGKIKCFGLSSVSPHPRIPGVETFAGQGFNEATLISWQGFLVPSSTPTAKIRVLGELFAEVVKDPIVRRALNEGFIEGENIGSESAHEWVNDDVRNFQRALIGAGISI